MTDSSSYIPMMGETPPHTQLLFSSLFKRDIRTFFAKNDDHISASGNDILTMGFAIMNLDEIANQKIRDVVSDFEVKLLRLVDENASLRGEVARQKALMDGYSYSAQSTNDNIVDLQNQLDAIQEKNDKLEELLKRERDKNSNLSADIGIAQEEVKLLREDLEKEKKKSKKNSRNADSIKIDTYETMIKQQNDQILKLTAELKETKKRSFSYKGGSEEELKKCEAKIAELAESLNNISAREKSYGQALDILGKFVINARRKFDDTFNSNYNTMTVVVKVQSAFDNMKRKIEDRDYSMFIRSILMSMQSNQYVSDYHKLEKTHTSPNSFILIEFVRKRSEKLLMLYEHETSSSHIVMDEESVS